MKDTSAGASIYTPLTLTYIYDWLTHGVYCPYVWRCPAQKLRSFFTSNITNAQTTTSFNSHSTSRGQQLPRILDIGVGTGYFLEQAPLAPGTEIVLADLNQDCINHAKSRVAKSHPRSKCEGVTVDFLDTRDDGKSLSMKLLDGGQKFDAISTMLLLHCVPGPPARKAAALVLLGSVLQPHGVLFGATILGRGVTHSFLGRLIMYWHNSIGVFDNYGDDVQGFIGPLTEAFESVEWQLCGAMLLYEARGPRVGGS